MNCETLARSVREEAGSSPAPAPEGRQHLQPQVLWEGFADMSIPAAGYIARVKPRLEPSDFADPTIVAIVREKNAPPLQGLLARLESGAKGALFRPEILSLPTDAGAEDFAHVEHTVMRIMAERFTAMATRNVDLTRELFEVRRVHEDLQSAFEQVEHYLHANGFSEPSLLLELPLSEAGAEGPSRGLVAGQSLVLSLPYELNRVAAVSLFVRRRRNPLAEPANLRVTLTSGNAGTVFGEWRTPVERLPEAGWFSFLLDRLSIDYGHSFQLMLELEGEADVALALSARPLLGASIVPVVQHTTLQDAIHAMPAVRLWRGLPGARIAHHLELQPFDFEVHGGERSQRRLAFHAVPEAVEPVFATTSSPETLVSVHEDSSIQVHPAPTGIVVARLRQALPEAGFRVEAMAGVHHEEASGVEFAMVVAEDEQRAVQSLMRAEEGAGAIWTLATYDRHALLDLECGPSNAERHLYLATRLAPEGTPKYAWARFRNVRVVV